MAAPTKFAIPVAPTLDTNKPAFRHLRQTWGPGQVSMNRADVKAEKHYFPEPRKKRKA